MSKTPFIMIISENAEFDRLDDDYDQNYKDYSDTFSKIEAACDDYRLLIRPPEAEALKGFHADMVLLEADVEQEFYDRYVKTRVARRNGSVIDLEVR